MGQETEGKKTRLGDRQQALAAWGGGGGGGGGTEDGRVQETPLQAQETLWWDLKSRCDDVAVGLSPKPSPALGPSPQVPPPWPPGDPANAPSLYIFCFVLF